MGQKALFRTITVMILFSGLIACSNDVRQQDAPDLTLIEVVDGDTIAVDGAAHDLVGIDAPELGQQCLINSELYQCGEQAAFELAKILKLERPLCSLPQANSDSMVCKIGDEELAIKLLKSGLVYPTAQATSVENEAAEDAKQATLGFWRGNHISPMDWRNGQRLTEETANPVECPVLAISVDDTLKYVTPTHPDYEEVRTRALGSFKRYCSDEEARSAGAIWLRSGAE